MKRFMLVTNSILIVLIMGINALGALPIDYSPQWSNILRMSNIIAFDGLNGNASASVYGKTGTTKVEGTLTVYKQFGSSWIEVDSTTETTTTNSYVALSIDFSAVSGGYYKSFFEVTVTRNGVEESDTMTSYRTCP